MAERYEAGARRLMARVRASDAAFEAAAGAEPGGGA